MAGHVRSTLESKHLSTLCRRCAVLELNDKDLGGHVELSSAGHEHVSFGSSRRLFIDYNLEDTLPDLPILSASSLGGCAFCSALQHELIVMSRKSSHDKAEVNVHKLCYRLCEEAVEEDTGPWLEALIVYFKVKGTDRTTSYSLRFEIQADSDDLCARWLCKPIAGQVLSESGRRNLHQLLGDTLKTTGPSTPSYVPTRLVDVGGVDGENDPRLVISEKHWPPTGQTDGSGDRRYIALSYCWGSKEQAHLQLKTTSDSLHLRLQAIPLSTCPQTLYDAVMVCRALGVRYIWIDALCILQGDKSDWDKESATMANVYSNSILTIAAAQGDSCVSGFAERPVPSQINLPFKSTLKPSVSGRYSIFQSHRGDSLQNIDRDYGVPPLSDYFNPNPPPRDEFSFSTSKHNSFDADLDYSQWSTRAWTFQEASLSPRLLLFGKYMSHLLVDNYRISEDGTYLHGSGYTPWGKSIRTSYTNASHRDNEVHDDWRLLVKRYSERDLSYSEDKLPAISALAQHFAPYIGPGEYLAGLWSSDLHHGLLWAHFGMNTPQTLLARPASKYTTAPSWSWASQLEAIGWTWAIRVSITPEFEFLDAKVAIDGYNEYGRVKGGFLSLSTKICKLPSTCLHRTSVYIGMTFPYELHSTDGKYIAHLLFDWRHASVEAPKDPETGAEVEDGPTDLLSMVLISSRPYNDTELQDRDVYDPEILLGLLVLPTATPGEYTRAGLFFTEARHLGGRRFWDQVGTQTIRLV